MPYEKHTWLRGETITAENLNHLEDGIVGEQTTRASQDQFINDRIDQIIAPTGEAPNPTEITDARIGVDDTVYNTLGTAIRTQVGDLKNALDDVNDLVFDVVNMWDGSEMLGVRTQASGTQLAYSSSQTANYKTAKIKINPNTDYTLVRSGSSYLGSLTSSQNLTLADIIATNPTTPTNYKVIRTSATSSPTYVNFTSDANAEYLYICYTLTGENAQLAVYEGTYTDFQNGASFYTKEETNTLIDESLDPLANPCKVYGTGDNIYVECRGMLYNVAHIINQTIRADLWRVYSGAIIKPNNETQYLWNGQDADGVVQIAGEDDFIGGFHGDEILTEFKLFIDGVEQQATTFNELYCKEIVIYEKSDVYHCNTSALAETVAFKRNKVITFNKDGYTVKNYWEAQESLSIATAYFGMLSVQKMQSDGTTVLNNGYYTNDDYLYKDNVTGTPNSHDITEIVFSTAFGDVGISMKNYTEANYKANVSYYGTGEVRLKTYMGPIIASSNNPVAIESGSVLKGEANIYKL